MFFIKDLRVLQRRLDFPPEELPSQGNNYYNWAIFHKDPSGVLGICNGWLTYIAAKNSLSRARTGIHPYIYTIKSERRPGGGGWLSGVLKLIEKYGDDIK